MIEKRLGSNNIIKFGLFLNNGNNDVNKNTETKIKLFLTDVCSNDGIQTLKRLRFSNFSFIINLRLYFFGTGPCWWGGAVITVTSNPLSANALQ